MGTAAACSRPIHYRNNRTLPATGPRSSPVTASCSPRSRYAAGFTIDRSEAGLYLWARREGTGDCWQLVGELAEKGIIVGPGAFYGSAARGHVRISLTATDERVEHAAARLTP